MARSALLAALAPLAPLVEWPRSALVLRARGGALTGTVDNVELGESVASIPCEWEGEDLTIGVNLRYLLDWVRGADAETLVLRLGSETDIIGCFGDDGVTHAIMPMRT